tara:strand:+ start:1697 stop:2302 length:606 start_codon:yes stop_codon:yes gene_type:complete
VKKVFKIAITGNIGSGKTTASKLVSELGFKVFESDNEVKKLYLQKNVKTNILSAFSKSIENLQKANTQIDTNLLGNYVFENQSQLRRLEKIIYPELKKKKEKFIEENINEKALFFDIPLLFEKKLHFFYDKIIYLYIDESTQRKRVLRRKNMTQKKLKKILENQTVKISKFEDSISIKINTNCSRKKLKTKIKSFLKDINL